MICLRTCNHMQYGFYMCVCVYIYIYIYTQIRIYAICCCFIDYMYVHNKCIYAHTHTYICVCECMKEWTHDVWMHECMNARMREYTWIHARMKPSPRITSFRRLAITKQEEAYLHICTQWSTRDYLSDPDLYCLYVAQITQAKSTNVDVLVFAGSIFRALHAGAHEALPPLFWFAWLLCIK